MMKIALVALSNPLKQETREDIEQLIRFLNSISIETYLSQYLFEVTKHEAASPIDKAMEFNRFFANSDFSYIFDLSGGDLANEVLPYLDYEAIEKASTTFVGYSDLTTVINAIFAKTGKISHLYSIKNIIGKNHHEQKENFIATYINNDKNLFDIPITLIQGKNFKGRVIGGNIRCLLKLAGTPYWPDFSEAILLLESYSGDKPKIKTYLNQLQQMGVFKQINGLLLGTFTKLEEANDFVEHLVMELVDDHLPIAKTRKIGHAPDSKAIQIGKVIST